MANPDSSSDIPPAPSAVLGVDTGGTFTDFVLLQGETVRIHKVLSTPQAPEQAILQGIRELGLEAAVATGQVRIIHGSTVATNAALEGKGVKTALITNIGFHDLLTIGRQTRRELYNLQPDPVAPPVPADLCFELPGRVDAQGQLLDAPSSQDLAELRAKLARAGVEAVAINLLFSFLNPQPEQIIKSTLEERWFVSASHEVLAEAGEYERGITTWLNASLSPRVRRYLQRLQQGVAPSPLAVMQSTGGTMAVDVAARSAVNMLLSGPAGGLAAAEFIGRQTGFRKLLTFDMGGTSTDVALIDGGIQLTNEGHIGPWPVGVPQVDMHTIGAGGGSLARVDAGGLLQVGPQSAGADPGPACYGKGGRQATVTDANAVLGRLQPEYFLGGNMTLDLDAAQGAMASLARDTGLSPLETAHGIIDIANEHMVRALRVISIERGHDLDEFQLCCFGGAGGLHVCALAEALGMRRALVPNLGGVLSALGMVVAPKSRELSHAMLQPLPALDPAELHNRLQHLLTEGSTALQAEGVKAKTLQWQFSVDLRYQGQRFYLNLPWSPDTAQLTEAFHRLHEQRYGHRLPMALELVNLRCSVHTAGTVEQLPGLRPGPDAMPPSQAPLAGFSEPVPVYWREDLAPGQCLAGPVLVAETIATTFIGPSWQATVDSWGHLLLKSTRGFAS
ncbi:MAG: hydantoinase/oxoprolinase family protein [Pseudomonadota bacterium]|nr:hydantoinase/oxoprolinase family protein [Pseudomonadota bacterium]